ncbi:LOW QUALITY PROTEIN: interferon-induced very large GTPase 1-like [Perognathus longimembris pacificus]|uniref:LOW QUALITY PROTEIN: interferon-induced very large GTPase 1-like n=1 Tax=Perognathus longimembris pacificus TaxID=214514 RepID=UPI0020189573|nr:LOW QUALITY PROTEIN: interferon-induced very large GTPase 1-like [Perognathus longimembris pacificus]
MATKDPKADDFLLKEKRGPDLQEMLTEVGLSVEYWLPKLQEHLGVTHAQALQHIDRKELQKLKLQVQHPWEKRALEKVIDWARSNSTSVLENSPVQMIKKRQMQAEQKLQELRDLLSAGKHRQEESMRRKEAELRKEMEIPEEYWPPPEQPLSQVMESIQKQLNLTTQTLSHRQNLPDRDLVRRASGGLALQGIYKTSHQTDLMQKREELLSVPEEFILHGPEQGTQMESREFTSSQTESMFTKIVETLGFSVAASSKGEGWGFSLEAGVNQSTHSESKDTQQSWSKRNYFCSMKFSYIPLASCHFPMDQLQLSKAAFQELKTIEKLLNETSDSDRLPLLRQRTENFFLRFGSHANQGPLHLGGIYWWKATAEGFQSHQLNEVKTQAAEALDAYIRGSYNGFGVQVTAGIETSHSHSKAITQRKSLQNLQTTVQLSVSQSGGPAEADGLQQWKAGLVASNQTWHVIDRGLQLVPIWDIILSNHTSDFKDPLQLASCLKDSYIALTGLAAQIQGGEEILSAGKEVREFLEEVKSWEVSDPEKQLKQLMDFMQMLSHKMKGYDTWIKLCLTDPDLQNFLVNTFDFCKKSPTYNTKFIKSQFQSLLDPHIYKINFPHTHSIMQWIYQAEAETEPERVSISQFSQLIKILKEIKKHLMEVNVKSDSMETVEEAQRKATYEVSLALSDFLNFLQRTKQTDKYVLLLSIAVGGGYQFKNGIFHHLLTCDELNFLLEEMPIALSKYQELQNGSNHKAQAFLLLTGLNTTTGCTAVSPEEKMQRLALMRQQLGQTLTNEVAHILSRHGEVHTWVTLEQNLRSLIDGNYENMKPSWQIDEAKPFSETLVYKDKHADILHTKENKNEDIMKNEAFLDLLKRLGLENYYPKMMSRANFHLIYKNSVYNTQPKSEQELPFYFLQKLLVLDCGLRYLDFKNETILEYSVNTSTSTQENEDLDPYEGFFEDNDSVPKPMTTRNKPNIHPMDIQMAIYHCADNLARQYILAKLSICQFALPLVVPNPCTSEIEFSLWSLRKIRKSWQTTRKSQGKKNSYKNQQMCQVSTSIVSFIRVGNSLSASKSQIMNCLLSKRKHDVFFHRHCRASSKDCLLMGGVVEICWFCPGGEEEDTFDNCVAFTNLHGDAKEHKRQLAFLQEISSLIVVLMSVSDDNKENQQMVRDLWQSTKPLIFLLDDKEKTMANKSERRAKIGIRNRNEAELTEELKMTIRHFLEISDTALTLEDCSLIAHKEGFLLDEKQKDCKEAKEKAQVIMALLGETNLSQIKENFLPLQGQLWQLWCKKDKELYQLREKGNKSIEHHKIEIETEKQSIRKKQLEKATNLNDVMRSVLQILQHSEIHTKLCFLQWLGLFLENLTAAHLEKLHEHQRYLWSQIKTENQKAKKNNSLKLCENQIEAISKEIQDCTLGIEQILREIGQLYEALEETSYTRGNLLIYLPQIAADLMLSGVPIELMDGDASYVPLKWVSAVFDKVSEKLGDKRIFILSVLGLQSSGKSTLLNALFGLQFTVSAGRCTRGVYMQLLKVKETFTKELGFDFLLVVDTEGLRAPELNNKSQKWDNELATFVIGLGNLTIINIFGENPSEMQDILQIAVQAFLRMKQVKISPSCLFVHQNVGEVAAEDQTMEGRRRLEQKLDEMTALAAEQEECSHITRFSDVIKFDAQTHIYYFAHLWDGNPPMAPPNPRYSHNVQELKQKILSTAKQEVKGSILKISHVKSQVQDLWRALVSENFIFNFKNTREIMAMGKLETMYNQWSWLLRSNQLELQNRLTNEVKNGKLLTLHTSIIAGPITKEYESIKQAFQKYFAEDPDSEIIIQWKANFENKLVILKDTLVSDTRREINELIALKKSQERLDQKKIGYETELLKRSQELALTLKCKELSEEDLHDIFNQVWKNWVCDVLSNLPEVTEPNIEVDCENILLDHFKSDKHIRENLNRYTGTIFEINFDKHVQVKKKMYVWSKSLEACDKESVHVTTKRIFSRFQEVVNNIERQKRDYNRNDYHEILRLIEEEVKSDPNEKTYTFTSKYITDLSLHLFHRAAEIFKERHRAFKAANDPVNYLESKKEEFFLSFKISCQGATSITTFVDFLWQKLTPAISNTIWGKMPPKIAEYLRSTCPAFNGNRANLEKHILISLAEEENFDKYWQYIHDPKSFFSSYIGNHIKQYCLNEGVSKIKTFFSISLGDMKTAILTAIHESTAIAKDKGSTASEWLDLFCNHLGSNLIFPRRDLVNIEHQEIKDTEFLKEAMSKDLDPTMKKIEEQFSGLPIDKLVPEVEKILSGHLCGCWKQCPVCKAICTNTIPNHDGDHRVPFHRPQGVIGIKWYQTDHFVIDCCSSLVASDCQLVLRDDWKIPYKNYRQAGGDFATWSITPDSSTQPYWKWFVSHFRSKLGEKYRLRFIKRGEIPKEWMQITKQYVLNNLKI